MHKHTQGWRSANGTYQSDLHKLIVLVDKGFFLGLFVAGMILVAPYLVKLVDFIAVNGTITLK